MRTKAGFAVACALVTVFVAAGCRRGADATGPLRLGAFPNVTHGQALVGARDGTFARALSPRGFELKQFSAGPSAMEALLSGSLDASYVGTGPALNAYVKGNREVVVLAAAANGGAVFVTRTARNAEGLRGKKVAAPQLGNTQDIALRSWLRKNGLEPGKDVEVVSVPNTDIVALFSRGDLEGAWVPEPWGARLIAHGAHLLVDERDLWPERRFHTTLLVTTKQVLQARREDLKKLVRAHVELTRRWERDPAAFARAVNQAFGQQMGQPMDEALMAAAFSRLEPALRPDLAQLRTAATMAKDLGYLRTDDVSGIVDTTLLDEILAETRPSPPVAR